MPGDDLFTGIEDVDECDQDDIEPGADSIPAPDLRETLEGMARTMLREWYDHLSYREIHAFILGWAPWFLFVVTGDSRALAVGLVAMWAALTVDLSGKPERIDNRALRAIVKEPWYCYGGAAFGWMGGTTWLGLFRVVDVVVGVVA